MTAAALAQDGCICAEKTSAMAEVAPSEIPQAQKDELLMTYAAMIIADSGVDMTAANMEKVIKAAGGKVDSFLPKLFCKTLEGKELKTYIDAAGKPGAGGGGGGGGAAAAAGGDAPAAEAKKEEVEEEEEEDMDFDLFG